MKKKEEESLFPTLRPWGELALKRFREDLDALFENLFADFVDNRYMSLIMFNDIQSEEKFPKINVSENDDEYNVSIAVAGFSKDDVKLELKDNILTVSAKKKEEEGEGSSKYLRREIAYRSFYRAIKFPCKVDADKAKAEYRDGIINFKIDKVKENDSNGGVTIEVK